MAFPRISEYQVVSAVAICMTVCVLVLLGWFMYKMLQV
jgi:hypothetical protein